MLKLSEFVMVTFRGYCTKERIALNKNYEISLVPSLPLPRGGLSAAALSAAQSPVNIGHEYSFGELAALHHSLTYLEFCCISDLALQFVNEVTLFPLIPIRGCLLQKKKKKKKATRRNFLGVGFYTGCISKQLCAVILGKLCWKC